MAGCDASVATSSVSPESASEGAIGALDKDASGALSRDEAAACPALFDRFGEYDSSGDGQLSAEELRARFEQLFANGAGLMPVTCFVTDGGAPVNGAIVRFVPEDFLSRAIEPATGKTDASGRAEMSISAEALPKNMSGLRAMRPGLYRIEVERAESDAPGASFGVEINPVRRGGDRVEVAL